VNAFVLEVFDEGGVFDAAHAVANARWRKSLERLPYACGAAGLTGVGGAVKAVVQCILKSRNVRIDREAGFVSSDIERGDARAFEALDELRGQHALRLVEVSQRAKNQAAFNPRVCDALLGGAIDEVDYGLGRESLKKMQQWGKANFSVDHLVASELFKDVFGHDAQRVFSLHELKAARGTGEKVGQAGALRRGYELGVVLPA
jgi:hypothetical protein